MGHYDDCYDAQYEEERKFDRLAAPLVKELRNLPASKFTVNEIWFLNCGHWSKYQTYWREGELKTIKEIYARVCG